MGNESKMFSDTTDLLSNGVESLLETFRSDYEYECEYGQVFSEAQSVERVWALTNGRF